MAIKGRMQLNKTCRANLIRLVVLRTKNGFGTQRLQTQITLVGYPVNAKIADQSNIKLRQKYFECRKYLRKVLAQQFQQSPVYV